MKIEDIRGVRIFDNLSENELQSVAKICREKKFWEDNIVIRQGEIDKSINILIEGKLQIEVEIPGFRESIPVHTLEPKEIFGELAFISGIPRSATVKCLSTTKVLSLDRSEFDKLCKKNPNIERIVMRNLAVLLAERLRNTTIQLRDGISRLPSRIESRKTKSILSELTDWVNSMKGFPPSV